MKQFVKMSVVGALWHIFGRRNLVRFARFLTNEARLDCPNDMASNGEVLVQEIVLKHASRSRQLIVFDVGANVGRWTRSFFEKSDVLRLNRNNAKVYAFEPCSSTYETLRRTFETSGERLTTVQKALSNTIGRSTLYVVADGAGRNSLYEQKGWTIAREEIVELSTVDAFCKDSGLSYITFLKIDAEGNDFLVIEGAREMLQRHTIELIQFEYNYRWTNARHYLCDAFELLVPCGYRIGKLTPKGIEFYKAWDSELESFREANYLACLEEWVPYFPAIRWWNDE